MPRISPTTIGLWDAGGWRSRAACRGTGPDLFFPHGETAEEAVCQTAQARKVCAGCPVRLHCLVFALAAHPLDGIWGGLTPSQRTRLRYRRLHRRTAAREHGPAASSWPEAGRSDRRVAVYDHVIGSLRLLDRQGRPTGSPEPHKAGLAVGEVATHRVLAPQVVVASDAKLSAGHGAAAGIDVDALAEQLQRQGAGAFSVDWNALLQAITAKAAQLRNPEPG